MKLPSSRRILPVLGAGLLPGLLPVLLSGLLLGVLLSGCAATRDVEMEPGMPDAADADADAPPDTLTDIYPEEVAGTARQLYGDEVEVSSNEAYLQAAEQDPALRYNVIYFEYNSSVVGEEGRELLARHAEFLKEYPEAGLRLEGHADERGSAGYNLALGEQRAKAVRDLLQVHGVDTARVSILSYGEERPAVEGRTEEAYSRNRRAELVYQ